MRFVAFVALVACLALCACQSAPAEPERVAGAFIQAVNAKNVERMAALVGTPFRYRNQPWESAPDGSGFVLGKAEDRVATTAEELRAVMREVSADVQVEDQEPVGSPPSKTDLLSGPLNGAPLAWSEMNLVLFRRGEADVEHVAVVGVDAVGKVIGLYVN
jgi:hypothetical protein